MLLVFNLFTPSETNNKPRYSKAILSNKKRNKIKNIT